MDWDVVFAKASNKDKSYSANGKLNIPIRVTERQMSVGNSGREVFISGTKLKVTSGAAMRYILSPTEAQQVIANSGNKKGNPPDSEFLRKAQSLGKRPLLIIEYVKIKSLCSGSLVPAVDSFFAFSFGFPGSQDAQMEQEFYFTKRAYEESSRRELWNSEMEV